MTTQQMHDSASPPPIKDTAKSDKSASTRSVASLLNEIGLIAAGRGRAKEAEAIFNALALIKPASEIPYIGHAITAMNAGKWAEAISWLQDKALAKAPASEAALCFLGLALKQKGDVSRAEEILGKIADSGKDASAVAMAMAMLGRENG